MNKTQMQSEITRLREENSILRKMIRQMESLNRQAFKLQHEAERKLNAMYASRGSDED